MKLIRVETLDDPRVGGFRSVPDPVRLREDGSFVAEGRFAVRRLLANHRFRVRALLVTDTALAALSGPLREGSQEFSVYVASRAVIRGIGGYDFHQGCLGLAERPQPDEPGTLLDRVDSRQPIVVLEQVGNADNVGGVFRNAAALGAAAVLLSPGCCDPLYRKAVRTSIATSLEVPFAVVDDWPAGLEAVGRRGYELVALTPSPAAMHLTRYRAPRAGGVAFLLGNEGDGLTPEVLDSADTRVRIVLEPPVDSLNVATTAALALHHLRGLNGSA